MVKKSQSSQIPVSTVTVNRQGWNGIFKCKHEVYSPSGEGSNETCSICRSTDPRFVAQFIAQPKQTSHLPKPIENEGADPADEADTETEQEKMEPAYAAA